VWRIERPRFIVFAAVGASAAAFLLLVYVPRVAAAVGHGPPPLLGVALAMLAAPAVLLADAAHKAWRRSRRARG
jgi:hypothetical protein